MPFDYSISRASLLAMTERYLSLFPFERDHAADFVSFIAQFDGDELICRRNFTGHLTASTMIFDPVTQRFLLLKHHSLGKWLQPGGHVETSDGTLLRAACREVYEETGLGAEDYRIISFAPDGCCVLEIDSHSIPTNERKAEPAHFHHDVRFLFCVGQNRSDLLSTYGAEGTACLEEESKTAGHIDRHLLADCCGPADSLAPADTPDLADHRTHADSTCNRSAGIHINRTESDAFAWFSTDNLPTGFNRRTLRHKLTLAGLISE